MRWIVISGLMLTACSHPPVVDLRGSAENAQYYQRDLNECQMLIDQSRGIIHAHFLGIDPMLVQCLEGRGHSVLTFQ